MYVNAVLYSPRPGAWIAQGVDYDITAQGKSYEHCYSRFAQALHALRVLTADFAHVKSTPHEVLVRIHETRTNKVLHAFRLGGTN